MPFENSYGTHLARMSCGGLYPSGKLATVSANVPVMWRQEPQEHVQPERGNAEAAMDIS